jgi:hypothetical protein
LTAITKQRLNTALSVQLSGWLMPETDKREMILFRKYKETQSNPLSIITTAILSAQNRGATF